MEETCLIPIVSLIFLKILELVKEGVIYSKTITFSNELTPF